MRIQWVLFSLLVTFSSAKAETSTAQAPFDSYVCFDSTYPECVTKSFGANAKYLLNDTRWRIGLDGTPFLSLSSFPKTADKKVGCILPEDSPVRLTTLDFRRKYAVIFFSPSHLLQLEEAARAVDRAWLACERLVDAYHHQQLVFKNQDIYAEAQEYAQRLSSDIERFTLEGSTINWPLVNLSDGRRLGYPQVLTLRRGDAHSVAKVIRESERLRSLEVEFPNQAKDLTALYAATLREFTKVAFALEVAGMNFPQSTEKSRRKLILDGAWVVKGREIVRFQVPGQ